MDDQDQVIHGLIRHGLLQNYFTNEQLRMISDVLKRISGSKKYSIKAGEVLYNVSSYNGTDIPGQQALDSALEEFSEMNGAIISLNGKYHLIHKHTIREIDGDQVVLQLTLHHKPIVLKYDEFIDEGWQAILIEAMNYAIFMQTLSSFPKEIDSLLENLHRQK